MRKTGHAILLILLPLGGQAATKGDKAREKLAKDGVLFTDEYSLLLHGHARRHP